jgi:hypothetical protein
LFDPPDDLPDDEDDPLPEAPALWSELLACPFDESSSPPPEAPEQATDNDATTTTTERVFMRHLAATHLRGASRMPQNQP